MGKADISSSEKLEIEILASEETEAFTGKYFIFLKPILSFLNFFTDLSEIHSHKKDKLISSFFLFCFINKFQTKIQINFLNILFLCIQTDSQTSKKLYV